MEARRYFAHETAVVDTGAQIGERTKIWHFSHVMGGASIGDDCVIGQGCFVGNVTIGHRVKIQNNVSVYDGVTLEDGVFAGPSCVFTNVDTPRAEVERKDEFLATLVGRGATIGANATILCGVEIGPYAFIGAGSTVTADVPAYALVVGVPARQTGWMCQCGDRLLVSITAEEMSLSRSERTGQNSGLNQIAARTDDQDDESDNRRDDDSDDERDDDSNDDSDDERDDECDDERGDECDDERGDEQHDERIGDLAATCHRCGQKYVLNDSGVLCLASLK